MVLHGNHQEVRIYETMFRNDDPNDIRHYWPDLRKHWMHRKAYQAMLKNTSSFSSAVTACRDGYANSRQYSTVAELEEWVKKVSKNISTTSLIHRNNSMQKRKKMSFKHDGDAIDSLFFICLAMMTPCQPLKMGYQFENYLLGIWHKGAREDGYKKEIQLHNRDLRVMPADSWHQPDSIENKKNLAAIIKQKSNCDESSDEQLIQYYTSDNNVPIHLLNDDCLMHVFLYLPIIDRVKIERVCKRWRAVSQESWRAYRHLDLSQASWGFTKINKKNYVDTPTLRKILLRCGRFLNHIDFSLPSHRLSQSTLTIIGKLCPNLQIVDLSSLNVSSSGILSLTSSCSNITKFTLGSSTNSCDNDLLQLFAKNRQLKYLKITSNSTTGKCLLNLPADSIEEIIFTECNGISPSHFLNAIKKCHKLHSLSLQTCVSINDSVLQSLRIRGESLRNLEFTGYFPMLSSQAMKNLADLTNLQMLNVGQNISVTDECILAISASCKQLRYLDIHGCQAVTNKGIAGLSTLPILEKLIISYLGKITDQHLGEIFSLKSLQCRGCPGIKDEGLCTLVLMAPHLELLDISGCNCVTSCWVNIAAKSTESRSNGIILKVYVGGSAIDVNKIKDISPFLQIVNVDLCTMYMRPDYDQDFFPDENLSYSVEDNEEDNISLSTHSSHEL
ncbi:F-box/LRR-repeat protein 7-like isoform X3 [Belonocnema kinseyi]|uniref:F-box/LRR-repeat protein 7-like isoform X3 n=1 Tax=Belonocnema kinseyi TaxID=2817044 RepID=UPI00143DB7D9|nr:F-box/LRR-repeat protein 7-like isoform X3 [Belonocnema kinseyi]